MLGVVTSVLCGLSWGLASFSSGRSSREMSAPLLTALYNFFGVVLFGTLYLFSNENHVLTHDSIFTKSLLLGVMGGVGFSIGLVCMARGMSRGRAGILSPLICVASILIAVIYTLFADGFPRGGVIGGIGLLLVVPWLSSRTHAIEAAHVSRAMSGDIIFGLASGAGFGVYYVSLIATSEKVQFFVLMVVQFSSMVAMLITHIISRATWKIHRTSYAVVSIFVIFELVGAVLLRTSLNLTSGAIVSAVSGTIDPLGILALSRLVNKELFTRTQVVGFAIMALGIILVGVSS